MFTPTLRTLGFSVITIMSISACTTTTTPNSHSNNTTHPAIHKENTGHEDNHAHKATWGYEGQTGPDFWGDVTGNKECKIGHEQSPVNITKVMKTDSTAPQFHYTTSDFEVENNGHTVVYTPQDSNNTAIINGERYTLKQFHYHSPSEHQVSGINYPAEIHFVHMNADNNLAVVAVMLNPTSATPTLGQMISSSQLASKNGHTANMKGFNATKLRPRTTSFYHYAGSLTTPPCSEKVLWYVAKQPMAISSSELASLMQLYDGNNRPVQSQGKRIIKLIP